MAKSGVKLTKSWRDLSAALKPGAFSKRLQEEVRKATALNAMLTAREMRTTIKHGVDPANAELTQAIKGSEKPLIDKGALWKAITSKALTWQTGFAGLLRGRRDADADMINVGRVLHDGTSMRVTDAMRGLFLALANADRTGDGSHLTGRAAQLWQRRQGIWKPLAPTTTAITIKPRPWIELALQATGLRAKLKRNWEAAVQRAISPKGA